MCAPGEHDHPPPPDPRAAWANLRQPGPLGWKVGRVVANTFTKLRTRQGCCGNLGEPGC
jgi:hypothetical protein